MAGTCIRLMLVAICFSHLICMNGAIPVTRTTNLVQKTGLLERTGTERSCKVEGAIRKLLKIEVNDYPGYGANNRHTPRPQIGRGCIEC